jgi:hypothetical protein
MVLEKDGEDQLDRSYEKWRSITRGQGGEEYRKTIKRMKAKMDGSHLA